MWIAFNLVAISWLKTSYLYVLVNFSAKIESPAAYSFHINYMINYSQLFVYYTMGISDNLLLNQVYCTYRLFCGLFNFRPGDLYRVLKQLFGFESEHFLYAVSVSHLEWIVPIKDIDV